MSNRKAQIAADVADLAKRYVPDVLSRIELEDDTVVFEVASHGEFTMILPDTYPGEITVYGSDDFELEQRGTIEQIVDKTLDKLHQPPAPKLLVPSDRAQSCNSAVSGVSGMSEIDSHGPMLVDEQMEPLLENHIKSLRSVLGADAVLDAELADAFRVRITVSLNAISGQDAGRNLIDHTSGKAWGIDPELPLGVELRLPKEGYLSDSMDSDLVTSVWQEGFEDNFLLGKQLTKIMNDFISIKLGREPERSAEDYVSEDQLKVIQEYDEKKTMLMSLAQADVDKGFLTHLIVYLQSRLATVHEYCALCDQPFGMAPMLMRTVCTRTLCSHQFATFGKLITSAEGVNSQSEIVELLVFMFSCAAESPRKELVLDPYPCVYKGSETILHPKKKDYMKVQQIVKELMQMRQNIGPSHGAMWITMLADMSKEAIGLLEWVRASNRTFLAPLTQEERIPEFRTDFQYLLISAPPEKEAAFQKMKAEHGSFFAFHGSALGNWHSILRNGLKNASNTPLMSAGAAYGPGIYMGKSSSVSAGYSGLAVRADGPKPPELTRQITGNRFLQTGGSISMMAVCEVVNHPSVKRHDWGYVAPEESTVCTRFFLVFERMDHDVQLTEKVVAKIQSLMNNIGVGCRH